MQFSHLPRHDRAMTLFEVVVVLAILAVLIALLLPAISRNKHHVHRFSCVNNLKEDGLAVKIWEGDHNGDHPQSLSLTNGGIRELLLAGDVAAYFQIMSNELSTPIILTCPDDSKRIAASTFIDLNNTNISYFVNADAHDAYPQMVMFGDDNLAVDGAPVKPGVINLWTNQMVGWTAKRHHFSGNVAMADGSVEQLSNVGLTNALAAPDAPTNLIVIP